MRAPAHLPVLVLLQTRRHSLVVQPPRFHLPLRRTAEDKHLFGIDSECPDFRTMGDHSLCTVLSRQIPQLHESVLGRREEKAWRGCSGSRGDARRDSFDKPDGRDLVTVSPQA